MKPLIFALCGVFALGSLAAQGGWLAAAWAYPSANP
ncbi:MAG: hypothetical protein JWP08_2458, partial [Bryobacterales bacterium]|nr:hypothetical protein [Bryobacterales bacterium]